MLCVEPLFISLLSVLCRTVSSTHLVASRIFIFRLDLFRNFLWSFKEEKKRFFVLSRLSRPKYVMLCTVCYVQIRVCSSDCTSAALLKHSHQSQPGARCRPMRGRKRGRWEREALSSEDSVLPRECSVSRNLEDTGENEARGDARFAQRSLTPLSSLPVHTYVA